MNCHLRISINYELFKIKEFFKVESYTKSIRGSIFKGILFWNMISLFKEECTRMLWFILYHFLWVRGKSGGKKWIILTFNKSRFDLGRDLYQFIRPWFRKLAIFLKLRYCLLQTIVLRIFSLFENITGYDLLDIIISV